MIPKIIHYCWFGGKPLSGIAKRCVKTFNKSGGGVIKEWNETNCSLNETQYVKDAVMNKGWAFLSDYYRLKAIYQYGGIYFDTDIEVRKPFNSKFFEADLVLGYMYDCMVSTACIMSKPGHPFIKKLLDEYETLCFNATYANNNLMTKILLETYPNIKLNGKFCEFDKNCFLYPKEYFEAPILWGKGGYTVHHFTGFWKPQHSTLKKIIRPLLKNVLFYSRLLNVLYNKNGRKRALMINPFYEKYLKDSEQ